MNSDTVFLDFGSPQIIEPEQEEIFLEPILRKFFDSESRKLKVCLPAVVLNVKSVEELRYDVKILPEEFSRDDNVVVPYPTIYNVPMQFVGTDDTAVLFPLKQGQTVMVMFSQLSMDEFKGGSIDGYSAIDNRKFNLQDAWIIPSVVPFNRSPNRVVRHYTGHNTDDLTIVHNLGTSRENKIILNRTGDLKIYSAKKVNIDAPLVYFSGNLKVDGMIDVAKDIIINGRSLLTYMDTHNHNYTDDGNPMVTAPANPTT